jgi:protein-S-isoprenylcysteine O-methyltransferase Ste14
MTAWTSFAVIGLASAFVGLGLVVPLARLWIRHGRFGVVVHRQGDEMARFVGRGFGAGVLATLLWAAAVVGLDQAALSIAHVPTALQLGGLVLALGSLGLVVVAQSGMGSSWRIGIADEHTELVAVGLYRWIRHPIYTGLLGMLVGLVLLTPSPWTVMGAGWIGTLVALQARLEDEHLAREHGASWATWAAATGRFVPGVGRRMAS